MRVASKIWLLSFWIIIATPLVASKTTDATRSEEKEESVLNITSQSTNKPLSLLPPPPPIKSIPSIAATLEPPKPVAPNPVTMPPLMAPPSASAPLPPVTTAPISMPPLLGPPSGATPLPPIAKPSAPVLMPPLMGPPVGPTPVPSLVGPSMPTSTQSPIPTPPPLIGPSVASPPAPLTSGASEQKSATITPPVVIGPPPTSVGISTTTPSPSVQKSSIKDTSSKTNSLIETSSPVAPIPLSPQAEKVADISAESEDIGEAGLDTELLEQSTGNWLLKRLWWERAEDRYDKIRQIITQIGEVRMAFFAKRTELDKTVLDPFYLFVGLGQGELREIIGDLIKRIEKDKEEHGDMNADERALLSDLRDQKKVLEDLQRNIEQINKLDEEIDLALSRLIEQVNKSREYEQAAWVSFKEIANVLSDKKAQELFYNMETAWKNIKEVSKYIQSEFSSHFTKIINKTKKETAQIRSIIEDFRKRGIDFKERADKLEEIDKNKAAAPQQPKIIIPTEDNEDEDEDVSQSSGIMFWIKTFMNWIWYLITTPYHFVAQLFS